MSGSFTIDTDRLPAPDPELLSQSFYSYATTPPQASFGASSFSSTGNVPVPYSDSVAGLLFPVTGADYGNLIVGLNSAVDLAEVTGGGNGTVNVRRTIGSEYRNNVLAWNNALPMIMVDGVAIPDFSKIEQGAFGSYYQRNRYVADDVNQGLLDGPILSRTVRRWDLLANQSAGFITSISMQVRSVPEPGTWIMMTGGMAMTGLVLRRGRSRRADPTAA